MDTERSPTDYTTWTNAQLMAHVSKLEHQLRIQNAAHANCLRLHDGLTALERRSNLQGSRSHSDSAYISANPQAAREASLSAPIDKTTSFKPRSERPFDPAKYNTRYVAFKIAYFGRNYNGFEWHANNITPLPTVEEELWTALNKTKLIFPTGDAPYGQVNWHGTEYSKCGRTDKGVSAFGQVIALRVRSARPRPNGSQLQDPETQIENDFDHIADELEYPKMLNRVLPEDIRVLAWCPTPPPGFSARFSCRERRYRYFFTQPAFAPRPGRAGLKPDQDEQVRRYGWLDINKMKQAAKYFEGSHDFRNFCKIDPARQVTNYERTIYYAAIEEAHGCSSMPLFVERQAFGPSTRSAHQFVSKSQVFTFTVHGSAFLWHQIRCMVAILFLVGQGLEDPSIIAQLLDVARNPTKPVYEMADESPLVLWDCIYPGEEDDSRGERLQWIFPDNQTRPGSLPSTSDGRHGPGGINEVLWSGWRRKKIDEVLAGSLLDIVAVQGQIEPAESSVNGRLEEEHNDSFPSRVSTKVFEGGDGSRLKGEYAPVMQRARLESSEIQNSRYAARKGLGPVDRSEGRAQGSMSS